ncbi:hypothetical protein GF389_03590 [Candidatus Dojkabacteria bacterium]|nr:hypothetical protein [Candidatus Dojkabacteria bacterium]
MDIKDFKPRVYVGEEGVHVFGVDTSQVVEFLTENRLEGKWQAKPYSAIYMDFDTDE